MIFFVSNPNPSNFSLGSSVRCSEKTFRDMVDEVLVEWATSVDGWNLYEHIIKDIQVPQIGQAIIIRIENA